MLNSSRNLKPSERIILNRRDKETNHFNLIKHISQEINLQEKIKFDQKASKIARSREVFQAKTLSNQLKKHNLNIRKQKLFDLLTNEYETYKNEMMTIENTPEILKNQLISRIKTMKESKENQRRNFVNEQYEKIFDRDNEEMRKIKFERNKLLTVKELEDQMIDNQKNLVENYEENVLFEEYAKRQRAEQYKKELEKKENYEKMVESNATIIKIQMVIFFYIAIFFYLLLLYIIFLLKKIIIFHFI